MTVRTPGVEREHGSEDTESDKRETEEKILPARVNRIVVGYLENVPGELSALRRTVPIDTEKTEHQEGRTAHQHQGQLHCRIFLAARAPHTDQKVHRNQSHLIEHEHGEHVDGNEESEHTGRQETEPEEEVLGKGIDFPGSECSGKNDNRREENHQHRNAVHSHCKMNVERLVPHPAARVEHFISHAGSAETEEVDHKPDCHGKQDNGSRHHHAPYRLHVAVAATCQTGHHENRDDNEPYQNIAKHNLNIFVLCQIRGL